MTPAEAAHRVLNNGGAELRRKNAVPAAERHRILIQRANDAGFVDAASLAREWSVNSSTIRRDVAYLTRAGLIRRTHGGALSAMPQAAIDMPYADRKREMLDEKRQIARAAAELVQDGQTVILDNGSTTFQIAIELRRRRNLTIVTNDLLIALKTANHPTNRLHVAGGVLLDTVYTLVGPSAVTAFEGLRADWAFLGAEGVDATAGITNINVVELPVKKAMMSAASRLVFVADTTKFGRRALADVCRIDAAHLIITGDSLAGDLRAGFGGKLRCV